MPVISVSESASPALTAADANDHLRNLYDENDAHLLRLIAAATNWIEQTLGVYLLNASVTETFRGWTDGFIRPSRGPLSSVTSVKYYDSDSSQQTWTNTNYITTAAAAVPGEIEIAPDITQPAVDGRTYPWEVIYVAGFGSAETSIPDAVQHALRLLVEDFDRNRGNMTESRATTEVAVGVRRLLVAADLGRL